MVCFMCEHGAHAEVKKAHAFIVENIHCVDIQAMAGYIQGHLARCEDVGAAPPEADIVLHIQKHMLNPTVRTAYILRSLVDLSETLREVGCARTDEDQPLVDVRAVTLYLKVVGEIMAVYRTADPTKLLFGNHD